MNEITFYIPYSDVASSSGTSSDAIPIADMKEELKEIQKRCEDLKSLLDKETETDSETLYTCMEKVQKLLGRAGSDIRYMMDYAKNLIESKGNQLHEKDEMLKASLSVLEDIKSNAQHYLDTTSMSVAKVLAQTFGSSKKDRGSMEIVQGLIQKLEKDQSEPKLNLLEAAQRKVSCPTFCCIFLHYQILQLCSVMPCFSFCNFDFR